MSDVASAAPAAPVSTAPVSDVDPSEEASELEAEETAEEAAKKASGKDDKKSNKKKFSPKVNGKVKEIELDWDNEEEMSKYLSKALAADERFEEAAVLRKNVEQLVNALKTDTRGVLSHPELGIDLKKFAQDILNEEIAELEKSPEQKEKEQLQKQLAEEKKAREGLEEAKRTAEMERLQEQAFKQFDDEMTDALSKTSLPKSPYVVKRIADTMIEAVNMGFADVTVKDIMPIVEQQLTAEIQKMFETMPEEVMEQLIGKGNLSRMRKKRLATMKKPIETANSVKETGEKSSKDSKKEGDKKIKFNDLFRPF